MKEYIYDLGGESLVSNIGKCVYIMGVTMAGVVAIGTGVEQLINEGSLYFFEIDQNATKGAAAGCISGACAGVVKYSLEKTVQGITNLRRYLR
jgi:hypothetical protein